MKMKWTILAGIFVLTVTLAAFPVYAGMGGGGGRSGGMGGGMSGGGMMGGQQGGMMGGQGGQMGSQGGMMGGQQGGMMLQGNEMMNGMMQNMNQMTGAMQKMTDIMGKTSSPEQMRKMSGIALGLSEHMKEMADVMNRGTVSQEEMQRLHRQMLQTQQQLEMMQGR